jgi:uncharacterized membrane protein (UPF0127 family)
VTDTKLIVNLTSGKCVCVTEMADRPLRRMRGLLGREGLAAGEGLLLRPAPAIHTAFMRFPIDALFLDRNMRVLEVVERLRPWRLASKRHARAVLELAVGECARCGIEVGDQLELRDRAHSPGEPRRSDSTSPAASSPRPASNHQAVGVPATTPVTGDDANLGPALADSASARKGADAGSVVGGDADSQEHEGTRLQPLRVLVLSPDRRFRTVVSLLLARRNCLATTTGNASRLGELIVRERADVAVIDAGEQPATAAVAAAQTLAQPVGLVFVADEPGKLALDPPALPKWGPFGDLIAAIERADARQPAREGAGG